MRVRAAGALLLVPLFAITYEAMQAVGLSDSSPSLLRLLFWKVNGTPQADVWLVLRDVIFGMVLLVGVVAIFGPRFSRWLVAVVGIVLIALYVPWIVYDITGSRPSWLFDHYPWYYPARNSAIMLTAVSALAVILAVTDRDPRYRAVPAQPGQPQHRPAHAATPQPAGPHDYPPPPGYQAQPPPPGAPAAAPTPPPAQPPPPPSTYQAPAGRPAPPPSPQDDPTRTFSRPGPPPSYTGDDPTQLQPRVDPEDR